MEKDYIRKQFATYEIALKLKELGFDEVCLAVYFKNKFQLVKGFNINNVDLHVANEFGGILAPLWQQVIDWFREKYNLCIEIQCPQREFDFYSWTIHEPLGINDEEYNCKTYEDGFTNNYYKSREQAILKAIELCQMKE